MSTRNSIDVAPYPESRLSRLEVHIERGDDVFRSARVRSRSVRFLRVVLPALAGVAVFAFLAKVYVFDGTLEGLSLADIDLQSGALVMEAPRVSGFDETRRSYDIRADRAIQNLDDPGKVRLEGISARLGLDSRNSATLDATTGIYDTNAETLILSDGITIAMSSGYQATLDNANIDLKAGSMITNDPVELSSAEGRIRANEVEIIDRGRLIKFRRGVQVTLIPPEQSSARLESTALPTEAVAAE
jgi:lipopolysaccharide export system protein LptC